MPVGAEMRAIGSAVVYRNRWMTVREDRIVRADGSRGIYGVVEKPHSAVVAAVEDGYVFLVEQFRYPVGARYWELPQGAKEDGEIEPADLARAELREETGLSAASVRLAGSFFHAYGYSTQRCDVFLATGLVQGERELEPEEAGMVSRRFPVAEAERMIVEGAIVDSTTVAAFGILRLKGLL
jgi:8-oxo-dGTP pyrophosphatase MutT (NUDIX family)